MQPFRWGVFGTGAISAKFVVGLRAAKGSEVSFVASRSLSSAQKFAAAFGIAGAIEGYAEAAKDGGVDAIYIATPPAEHMRHALLCIDSGIPVLVEKPFAANFIEAQQIAAASRATSVFAMEAMWTRFLPAARALREEVGSGRIGSARMVSGSFGTSKSPDPESGSFDPKLGGGAMAQLGVYPLSLAQWLFGTPLKVQAVGVVGPTGVDEDVAFQLRYPGGVTGAFHASIRAWAPNDFQVLGTEGIVGFRGSIVRPYGLDISRQSPIQATGRNFTWRTRVRESGAAHILAQLSGLSSRSRSARFAHRYAGNGYHYEADEVRACVERGAFESDIMPLRDSLAVAHTVDDIRGQLGREAKSDQKPTEDHSK